MNPRKIRALREVASELLRIEDALKNEAEAARTTRLTVAELIPVEPADPDPPRDRPKPRPKPRPVDPPKPVEPPVRPPAPARLGDVSFRVNGETVVLRPTEGQPATHILGDLALVAWADGEERESAIVHAFPSTEPIALANAEVSCGSWSRKFVRSAAELLPGHGIFAGSHASQLDSPLPAVNEWLEELAALRGGLEVVDGVLTYGNGDANEGGGQLIYPYIQHWADSGAGTICARWVMEAYAARSPVFRWDRTEFEQGRIVPHKWGPDFQGIDRTATYAPEGYALPELHKPTVGRSELPKVGGTHDALDHQHLGRIGHVTAWCARQGSPMAKVILNALAEDVRLSWAGGFEFGEAQVADPSNPNFVYWDCFDVLNELPAHDGCPFMGREFAHAMMVTAHAAMYGDDEQREDQRDILNVMLDAIAHVYDRRNKTALKLTLNAPVFGYPSGGYAHKRGVGQPPEVPHNIPDGKNPPVVKPFETGLQVCALGLAQKALGTLTQPELSVLNGLRLSLRTYDQELRAIGHPAWGSDKGVLWTPLLLGEKASRFGEPDLDLRKIAETVKPNDGSNPCAAFSGNWEDLA